MKQKLLLLAAVLCSTFSVQAVDWTGETLEGNGVYYLYNVNAGVFLNSNGSVGTAPVDQWYFTNNGNGTYTVKALKLNNVISGTDPTGQSDYNFIWLDVAKSSTTVNYVNAYTKDHPDDNVTDPYEGASPDLTIKAGSTGGYPSYQFYFVRTWRSSDLGLIDYYGSAFLAADANGIKAVEGGTKNLLGQTQNPEDCTNANTYWYLVKKDTYDAVADASYYFKVQSSATLGCSTDLSFDGFQLDANGHEIETELGATAQYQMNVPSGETVDISIPIYALAKPKNDFYKFTGWKTAETDENYISTNGLYQLNATFEPGTTEGSPTVTLVAEFTQIYTDAPDDGPYALYNPENGVYMTSDGTSNSVTPDPTQATIYTFDSFEGGLFDNNEYTTLQFGDNYVGQNIGSSSNSGNTTNWIVVKSGNGYTLHVSVRERESIISYPLRNRYITTDGNNISFPDGGNGNNSIWMFIKEEHMNSIIAENTALLAVNANVGYGTFVAPFDVTLPTGVTAFTVTGFEGSTLTLNNAPTTSEGKLLANTAVILKSTSNVYETVFGAAYGVENEHSGKYLVGTYERTAVPEGSYLLQYQNNYAAFFLVDGTNGTLYSGKNRAYLTNVPQEGSEGEVKAFSLNGTETEIDEIIVVNEDTAIYDLSGRRLSKKPARGIYIQNGKKILVK